MTYTEAEEKAFRELLQQYIEHPRVLHMNDFSQHGSISTFAHCYSVARFSFWVNRRLAIGADEKVLLPAALLHDMFLYDWHTIGRMNPYHATNHAELACRNAIRYCDIDEKVQLAIRSHMWPVNITRVPYTKEAAIICFADKWCTVFESVLKRKGMKKQGPKR